MKSIPGPQMFTSDNQIPSVPRAVAGQAFLILLAFFTLAAVETQAETKLDFWHSYRPPAGPIHYSFRVASYKRGIFFGSCGPSTRSLQWEYDIDLAGPGTVYRKDQVNITSEGKRFEVISGTVSVASDLRDTTISLKVQAKNGAVEFLGNGTHTIRKLK